MAFTAADLAVIIPTHKRWPILRQTLAALAAQTVQGFHTTVVVDGRDFPVPEDLVSNVPATGPAVEVVVQDHGGPGAARNRGVRLTTQPLVLFLGDDMVPTPELVARHLAVHNRCPEETAGVLGHVEWHPDVPRNRVMRWLETSDAQFDFANITGEDAGWGRFYSCNVSLKRSLFTAAGGFDEDFTFDYEDLDLAYRLHEKGMQLLYEPAALAQHQHTYGWDGLQRRYESRARAEWMMQQKHDWFSPWFLGRMRAATKRRPVSTIWPALGGRVPSKVVDRRSDRWFHQQLAPWFLNAWEGERALAELREYLGDRYDQSTLVDHAGAVDREEHAAVDEETFYRTSETYLYDLTAFGMSGTKVPYVQVLKGLVPPKARLLDYGCGIGADGLPLLHAGYRVDFADFDNPSTRYLRWRLEHRGLDARVYDLDVDTIGGGYDAAYCFDVIEHVEDPVAFLERLESLADIVVVNLLADEPDDTHLHKPLPIDDLVDRAASKGLLHYGLYHGRSHLIAYRSHATSGAAAVPARARSMIERRLGPKLHER